MSIDRPKLGSLRESLKPVDFDRVLNNFSDEDGDDDDDDDDNENVYGSVNRPKLVLSGPYHYEVHYYFQENIFMIVFSKKIVFKD